MTGSLARPSGPADHPRPPLLRNVFRIGEVSSAAKQAGRDYPQRAAVLFALCELDGSDGGTSGSDWVRGLQTGTAPEGR